MTVVWNPLEARQWDRVLKALAQGHPVGMPTETVYGLAGLARDQKALARIFELKARPRFDPLIVHVPSIERAKRCALNWQEWQDRLAHAFWPGPLSILCDKQADIPDLCTAGSAQVVLRCPQHPVFLRALNDLGQDLAAPSANRFGKISPTSADAVVQELGPFGLGDVVDGGGSRVGIESTIVGDRGDGEVVVLRPGGVAKEAIEKCLGRTVPVSSAVAGTGALSLPGQELSHYAPSAKTMFFKSEEDFERSPQFVSGQEQALFVGGGSPTFKAYRGPKRCLSVVGDDREAAANLFSVLRSLDSENPRILILVGSARSDGLFLAIQDRLRRAGQKREGA